MVKQGKIIVLDGLDGCGKSTQFEALGKLLTEQGKTVKSISFPMYDKPSAALVKMYLHGDFSDTPGGVNAYAASSFYAVDRYANYKARIPYAVRALGASLCARQAARILEKSGRGAIPGERCYLGARLF